MHALTVRQLGAPETFSIEASAEKLPRPGQVRIAVAFAGISYVDTLVTSGRYQVKPPVPFVPGSELAGVVDAIGPDVPQERLGQRVCALITSGAFAEQVIVAEADAIAIPDTMSLESASVFLASYATSYYAIAHRGALRASESVLVLGAGGAVGFAAVQLAKSLGAFVVASASSEEKRAMALAGGADAAIDTRAENWRALVKEANNGRAVDLVVDPVSGSATDPAFRSLAWGGRHLVIGFASGQIATLAANLTLLKGASLIGVDYRQAVEKEPSLKSRINETLFDIYKTGTLTPQIAQIFEFADFAAAMTLTGNGSAAGRVVLRIGKT